MPPPVFVAGASPRVINRVANYGDGWLPVVIPEANSISPGRMTPLAEFAEMVPKMNALAEANGRPKPRIVVSGYLDAESFAVYNELGVESVSLRVPSGSMDEICRAMYDAQDTITRVGGSM